jgi:oxygen-dependent protoporphyrinogen oxidase
MRLKRHVSLLESTLRHVAVRPLLPAIASPCIRGRYLSTSAAYPERIAVLGGGIAGLASAYFVSREFPKSKVTVFEAGKDSGGWVKSKKVQVPGGEVIFELGPRTLRNATPTAHLVRRIANYREQNSAD